MLSKRRGRPSASPLNRLPPASRKSFSAFLTFYGAAAHSEVPSRSWRRGGPVVLGLRPMSAREGQTPRGAAPPHGRALWWLIAGRVLVAGALLGVSALWARSFWQGGTETSSFRRALLVALVVLVLSVVYALLLRFTRLPLRAQAAAQFFCDVLLITWLVWTTGDLHSPYSALYIVVIAVAGIFLGARGALLTAVGSAACYTSVMVSLVTGWLGNHGRAAAPLGEAVEAIGINDVAFLIVGLLSSRLAERQTRSDVQLIEA